MHSRSLSRLTLAPTLAPTLALTPAPLLLHPHPHQVRVVSFNYARTERTFFDKELEADFDKLEAAGPAGSEVSPPTLNLAPDPDSAPAPDPNDDPNLNYAKEY